MNYSTFEIAIVGANEMLRFLEVVAIDMQAAIADVQEAFFQPEIVSVRLVA